MKNKQLYILTILLSFYLHYSQDLQVTLPTKNKAPTLYIGTCQSNNYKLAKLINHILLEDFVLDARCKLLPQNEELLKIEHKMGNTIFNDPTWKNQHINYVIIPSLSKNTFKCQLFCVRTGSLKTLNEIKLTDKENENVYTIHQISDFLMKEIYGQKGIASKRILYSYKPTTELDDNSKAWKAEIYEMDSLGITTKRITFDNSYSITPNFIKNHSNNNYYEFLYVTYKIGQPQIYLGKEDGQEGKPLICLRGNQLLPSISQDGKYVTFISDASGKSDVFLQQLDHLRAPIGKPIQIYSGINQTCSSPSLSPDNRYITFVNDKTGSPKIYIANIESSISTHHSPHVTPILCDCSECTSPSFSPDGKKITFSGRINGRRQIWVYDIKTKKTEQVTSGPEDHENPCFASNSNHIIYNTTYPTTDIFILSLTNKEKRKLTKGIGDKHYPNCEK